MLGNDEKLKNNLIVSIDWIAFTSTLVSGAKEMFDFLGYPEKDWLLLPKGSNGYGKVYRLAGCPISVMCDGNDGMGVHVVVTGSAIHDLMQHYKDTITTPTPFGSDALQVSDFDSFVMREFLHDVKRIGWFTRLDLAVDDIGGNFFSVEDFRAFLDRSEVVSKFRKFRDVFESTLTHVSTGHTVYLGSRQSEVMLRVYDKRLEQNGKAEKEEDKSDTPWIRWELELKDARADIAADLLQQLSLGEVVTGVLNNYVRVVVLDDSNRSRCSIHPLWAKFVDTINKLALYVAESAKTIADKRNWFIRCVLPTLSGIIIADGGSFDIITKHFDDAVARMSSQMQQLVTQAYPDWYSDYDTLMV